MKYLIKVFFAVLLAVTFAFSGFQCHANAAPRQLITGAAQCVSGNTVIYTYETTICRNPTHDACTEAKNLAVQAIQGQQRCRQKGGVPQQSFYPCNYGAKC